MSAREISVLLGMCVIWGFHFIVIQLAVGQLPPMFYAAVRMTLVAAVLTPFLRWHRGQMHFVLPAGICLGTLNYAFMFSGLKFATASTAAIAMELTVPFATILAIIFLNDRIGLPRLLGISIAFIGVAIISFGGHEDASPGTNIPLGVTLVAMGAFVEACGTILVKKSSGFKPHELLAWFSLIGAGGLWLLTFALESDQVAAFQVSDKRCVLGAILYSAIGGSILGHSAYYWLLQRLPVSTVAPSILLTTLIAVIAGVVILGDPFGPRMVIGGLMVLAGVGTVLLRTSKKRDSKVPIPKAGATP